MEEQGMPILRGPTGEKSGVVDKMTSEQQIH